MIDLHIHSTFSDGTLSPPLLVESAFSIGLKAISLTDHDTTEGLSQFLKSAESKDIYLIPGVEIAGLWNMRELHILGYWIDWSDTNLQTILEQSRLNRKRRNSNILEKLNSRGYLVSYEELLMESKEGVIGRPHIASLLVKKSYFTCAQEAFSKCLSRGSECYVPRVIPEIKDVIDAIHSAGGLAIWAHPLHRNKNDLKNVKTDIMSLMNLGLDGVEAYYPEFNARQHQLLLKCAEELNLAVSGGTDYHGANQPGIELGRGRGQLEIPDEVYFNLLEFQKGKRDEVKF